ncbi:MAG: response regulator transcription factor [Verrucomicrobia bacterium]|nr:response regulator transcription factor [Verrucomicrobiota bacterium]MBI3870661.1 response regulator transcription factor [Verrucomicrobiota bacterium]
MKPASAKPSRKAKCRILILDDHPIMREGLAQLLSREVDLQVCAEAHDAREALEKIPKHMPDLLLADLSLPGRSGLDLIKDLHILHPDVKVLVLSMHDESLYAERVLRAGGRGYIMKQEGGKKLLEAIRKVLEGQIYVSEKMAGRILEFFAGGKPQGAGSFVESLTDRELEVFKWIGKGLTTQEIASQLNVSVKTVEVHRVNIKSRLQLTSLPELVHKAVLWVQSSDTE